MSFLRHAFSHTSVSSLRLTPTIATSSRLPIIAQFQVRTFAKKRKDTSDRAQAPAERRDAFVPGSQLLQQSPEYKKLEDKLKSTSERFRKDVADLEVRATGRVTPAVLAPVRVVLPDSPDGRGVRLEEIATVGVRDGSTLIVTVFEEHTLKHVEQAIYEAKLSGIIPQRSGSETIKIPLPKPTVEARTALHATAQQKGEDAKIHIRKAMEDNIKKGGYRKHHPEYDAYHKLADKYFAEMDKILNGFKQKSSPK